MDHRYQTTQRKPTNLTLHIDDTEMRSHIILDLPESYNNIVENIEDELDDKNYPLTIRKIAKSFW